MAGKGGVLAGFCAVLAGAGVDAAHLRQPILVQPSCRKSVAYHWRIAATDPTFELRQPGC